MRNKRLRRKRPTPSSACFRSSITTGSVLLHEVDGRSGWMRRYRDIILAHEPDLGGADILSEGQRAIIRRAALLQRQLELLDQKFAVRDDGSASAEELLVYQRVSGALRRLLETLGLHTGRKARDITPDLQTYLARKAKPLEAAE
jgi:hypothetical protein